MEDQNLQRGIQLFEIGRFEDATTYFSAALAEDPDAYLPKYFMAICHLNMERFDQAEKVVEGLYSTNPDDPDTVFLNAKVKFHLDRDKEALTLVDQAIAMDPYEDDYFALKADILTHLKQFDEALNFANQALSIAPKNTYALNIRAKILTKLGRKEEATSTVDNLLNENPEDDYSHANVGWVELENGRTQKALEHFREALTLNPNLEYARQGMSTALKSKNPIYALYLKYSFWMAKQSSKNQWFFIIGIYIAYRVSVKLLTGIGLTYLAVPLIILYLLFALGSWFMEPLSNSILNFDSYGKYLLGKDERKSGFAFGILVVLAITFALLFYFLKADYFLVLAVTFLSLLLPLPRSFLLSSKKSSSLALAYSAVMLLFGALGPLVITASTCAIGVFVLMVLYTWIGNFIEQR